MSWIIPYLYTQSELVDRVAQRARDTGFKRFRRTEMYNAINDAIERWGRRVLVPHLYTMPNGWTADDYDYTLPDYITPPLDVQQEKTVLDSSLSLADGTATTWVDIPAWNLEPDGSGNQVLRLARSPYTADGRIIWWGVNGPLPTSSQTLNAGITATSSSLVVAGTPHIGNSGYVKIDAEWIGYAGVTPGASTTTLSNLVRGVNDTTAATHNSATSVLWGVAAHRQDLFVQLQDQITALLHSLYLNNAAPQEIEHHTFQMRYYQQLADEFWRRYTPARAPKLVLSRHALGEL